MAKKNDCGCTPTPNIQRRSTPIFESIGDNPLQPNALGLTFPFAPGGVFTLPRHMTDETPPYEPTPKPHPAMGKLWNAVFAAAGRPNALESIRLDSEPPESGFGVYGGSANVGSRRGAARMLGEGRPTGVHSILNLAHPPEYDPRLHLLTPTEIVKRLGLVLQSLLVDHLVPPPDEKDLPEDVPATLRRKILDIPDDLWSEFKWAIWKYILSAFGGGFGRMVRLSSRPFGGQPQPIPPHYDKAQDGGILGTEKCDGALRRTIDFKPVTLAWPLKSQRIGCYRAYEKSQTEGGGDPSNWRIGQERGAQLEKRADEKVAEWEKQDPLNFNHDAALKSVVALILEIGIPEEFLYDILVETGSATRQGLGSEIQCPPNCERIFRILNHTVAFDLTDKSNRIEYRKTSTSTGPYGNPDSDDGQFHEICVYSGAYIVLSMNVLLDFEVRCVEKQRD